ncbi:hypothetical protein U732_2525 [Clostridium argentinense CDC 2741]|uniref:Uncharacterized protein n=1 Tax=Clostridium argentinense CDC 2741 TaxID=1418104 RepID=A0A0C1U1W9_9CLOT|nr:MULTISPECIES: hypothetical protein [Clostridium]ARC86905.1 hypothetical protein RSJ17_21625 [Clostridium argentinense]KIE45478.1 hypothetical protein U732_2525 [Clostridium argentinense CDC 2741]NFF40994.1 hypothetical protein [Clostridium argentinense]NFP51507.1 hypothetical protein [Clostridium argentinense]NFP73588.1 hypothetical protein [Clostridium argentinense]
MKENNLQLAQKDIDEALYTIEKLEKSIKEDALSEDFVKKNFLELTRKMQEIENLLKEEGIL